MKLRYAPALISLLALAHCGPTREPPPAADAGQQDARPADAQANACEIDSDNDTIPDSVEGQGDVDMDGIPNARDEDSDGDGIPDRVEAQYGSERTRCVLRPVDSDRDQIPDYLSTDSNGDGLADSLSIAPPAVLMTPEPDGGWAMAPHDFDRDGIPNYADTDADGDSLANSVELQVDSMLTIPDSDGDGRPDWLDVDSDADTIADRDEGSSDRDRDGIPNFRDPDSDGDGITDRDEAGDTNLETPPTECTREIDARTLMGLRPDGLPDYLDQDSDNDGAGDREERAAGTDLCNADTDNDGQLDVAENAYCARRMMTGCGTDRARQIPSTDYYIVLPFGATETRELEFGTNIRVADVFFLADTTGSMTGVLRSVRDSVGTMAMRIRAEIPNAWFGVGHYEDYQLSAHAASTDRVFHPLCDGLPGSRPSTACSTARYGGIMLTASDADVSAAINAIPGGSGGDGLSTSVEAMYQVLVGDGYYDRSAGAACTESSATTRCWVPPTTCPEGRFGAGCFRSGALPIMVHYSDTQSHYGARNPGGTTFNREPSGVTPRGHTSDDLMSAFRRVGGRMISLNASSSVCENRVLTMQEGTNPCYDFRVWAEGTGSVNIDGNPFIFDLRMGGGQSFIDATVEGVRQIASRTPLDISTQTENDPANPGAVNATEFISRRIPSCEIEPRNRNCWTPGSGVMMTEAVGRTDASTFYRVLPGTRVRFTIVFSNLDVFPGYEDRSTLFHAYIHVVGDGFARLDTREVFILVPARATDPG
ncbi:MAG: hypothetical protein Q8Q09_28950 [Deltaproteobacteria bacterium]|nr:hypothetical protein [Deltaproteobacteria bacterium]